MSAVIIEHVRVGDLPEAWRTKVPASQETRVTIRIETEPTAPVVNADDSAEDSLFGMWRDRDDMTDVQAYVRELRSPRQHQTLQCDCRVADRAF